jgi:tRNA dimethylallyltransferase
LAGGAEAGGGVRGFCPVIAGPTAAGKTALVLQLAAEFPLEVISLDSRQIYRGLRIGTAQPSAAEQAACRHHLIDFLAPTETYSAQRFREDFADLWPAIAARGCLPLLVGGAGLYLRAASEGFFVLPQDSRARLAEIRRKIAALAEAEIDAELQRVDPAAAARLHPRDRYRRRRALEIYRLAGCSASDLAAAQRCAPVLGLEFPLVRLERAMTDLDERIRARTEAMLAAGWIEETRGLLARHRPDCPGLRSLGYREIVRHLRGDLAGGELVPAIARATRQYAKRQRTWFARQPAAAAGTPDDPTVLATLRQLVQQGLSRLRPDGP